MQNTFDVFMREAYIGIYSREVGTNTTSIEFKIQLNCVYNMNRLE